MVLWNPNMSYTGQNPPDSRFIWVQADEALRRELLLSPGLSTIIAILLSVGGRPTTSMTGNAISMASAVALSHSLGLHRDPTTWSIPPGEKRLRLRLWWAILVHDRW